MPVHLRKHKDGTWGVVDEQGKTYLTHVSKAHAKAQISAINLSLRRQKRGK